MLLLKNKQVMLGLMYTSLEAANYKYYAWAIAALITLTGCNKHNAPMTLHTDNTEQENQINLIIPTTKTLVTKKEPPKEIKKTPSPFLSGLTNQDLDMIQTEARRVNLSNWKGIDARSSLARQRVLKVLEHMNAPKELLFVPVAESGYNPYALSPTGALGLWQLMPKTAIELGTTHRHGLDGRRHMEQSTRAAISYFLKLHQRFNNWTLALAAYNLGPWGVQKRLNKKPWQPEDGLNALPFPAETKHYVKQILGMVALQEQGELTFSEPLSTINYRIEPPIDLIHLEKVSGLGKHDLFRLNPELDYQHYLKKAITLHLPQENITRIESALKNDKNIFKPKFIYVKVKQGDSLWKIAHRHHTNIAYLRKLNPKLKSVLSINQTVKVPASRSFATASHKANPLLANGRRVRYKVRSGDSLWKIAKKFGTSSRAIARINQISVKKLLRPGDRLWIVARFRPS